MSDTTDYDARKRFTMTEVGTGFIIRDADCPEYMIRVDAWELPALKRRTYATAVLAKLNGDG